MPGLLTDCIKVSEIATSKIITDIPAAGSSLNISFKTFSNLCLAQCQCLCVCVCVCVWVCVCVCVCLCESPCAGIKLVLKMLGCIRPGTALLQSVMINA